MHLLSLNIYIYIYAEPHTSHLHPTKHGDRPASTETTSRVVLHFWTSRWTLRQTPGGFIPTQCTSEDISVRLADSPHGSSSLTKDPDSLHLAPISGSIDAHESPITAAWREIKEETTLDASKVAHWRTGKPFTFTDPSVNRQWTIYPFAFRLHDAARGANDIQTDWEHEEWGWFDPDVVMRSGSKLGGVPRLQDSLQRLWFEGTMEDGAGKVLASGLETLQKDHESGSQELTSIALGVFRDIVERMLECDDRPDKEEWWATVCMAAWHLAKNGRESMGISIMNALVSILGDINAVRAKIQGHNDILGVIDEHIHARKGSTRRIRDSFITHLQSKINQDKTRINIVTLSASSTIRDSILDAFAALDHQLQTLDLRILESRPLFEGVTLASSLYSQFQTRFAQSKTLEIKLYTDASAAFAAKDADMLLIGADRISSSKGVSNKTGSLPGVLSARHVQPSIEVVVLSDLDKVEGAIDESDDAGTESAMEENDPVEVLDAWRKEGAKGVDALELASRDGGSASVEVKNIYFEWVPLDLLDTFVCGQGVLKGPDLEKRARHLGETMHAVMGDL